MIYRLLFLSLLFAVFAPFAGADDTSHQAAAAKLLALMNVSANMRAGFMTVISPMLEGMAKKGMSPAGVTEVRETITKWYDDEIKWEDIQPKFAAIYADRFTEPELNDLLAFYQTPTGKKALTEMPALMQEGAQIGQTYAQTKQASLQEKLKPIIQKYAPQKP